MSESAATLIQRVVEKISPGVLEIAATNESGKIVINFGPGGVDAPVKATVEKHL